MTEKTLIKEHRIDGGLKITTQHYWIYFLPAEEDYSARISIEPRIDYKEPSDKCTYYKCEKSLTEDEKNYSFDKFGRSLCREHQGRIKFTSLRFQNTNALFTFIGNLIQSYGFFKKQQNELHDYHFELKKLLEEIKNKFERGVKFDTSQKKLQ